MSPRIHIRSFLVFVARAVLLVAFAAASLAAVAERRAPDRIHFVAVASDHCMKTCNETFIKALQDEHTNHKNAVKACGANFVCKRDESYRHRTTLLGIMAIHKTCRNGCSPQAVGAPGT